MGPVIDASRVKRAGRRLDDQGRLSEIVEMGRDPVFFEFIGRGAGCGSAWLFVQGLPGYAERQTPPAPIRILVPTCAATREGVVRLDARDGGTFGLDRTEVTSEQWLVYAEQQSLTGDQRSTLPPTFSQGGRRGLPLVGINAFVAERFCRFFGRKLPTVEEWMRATKTHPQVTAKRVSGCAANLDGASDGSEVMDVVGSCSGDVTEEGVVDLLGNVSEWTFDDIDETAPELAGLRQYVGANWSTPVGAPPTDLTFSNSGPATYANYALGVRCAAE
jgi:formylglycine-generating enzyme required for sulfatase activity